MVWCVRHERLTSIALRNLIVGEPLASAELVFDANGAQVQKLGEWYDELASGVNLARVRASGLREWSNQRGAEWVVRSIT